MRNIVLHQRMPKIINKTSIENFEKRITAVLGNNLKLIIK